MKHPCTLTIAVIFILLLSNVRSSAQTLYAFPQPGFVQTEVYHQDWTQMWAPVNHSFIHLADTTVGSYTFARFSWIPVGSSNPWYMYYDNGKIFWHGTNPQWSNPTAGILMYDFALAVGDTFNFTSGSMAVYGQYFVDSVGTRTMLNAQVRKYLRLNNGTDTVEWIDAIGDIERGFFYAADFEGGYEEFICTKDSTGDVYGAPSSSFYCDAYGPIPNSGPNTCDQFAFNAYIYGTSCWGCDGAINITNVTGGTPAYTYLWSNGATTPSVNNLCQGPITLTIYDATGDSCSRTFIVYEGQFSLTVTHDSIQCDGVDTVCVVPYGGSAPYFWQWSPAGTSTMCYPVTNNGTYTVTVTDVNGCTVSVVIPVNTANQIYSTPVQTAPSCSTCCDGNINLNIYVSNPPYSLSTPGWPSSGAFCQGWYYYCITDADGCSLCDSVLLLGPMGVSTTITGDFSLTPNPAADVIQIHRTCNEPAVIVMRDVSGKSVGEFPVNGKSAMLDVTVFAEGIYFVSVDGITKRIIIARE